MKHAREDYNRIQDPAGKIPADEPVFLIRGQDALAAGMLDHYANRLRAIGGDPEMVKSIRDHADRLAEWQRTNSEKVKTPDLPADMDAEVKAIGKELKKADASSKKKSSKKKKEDDPADGDAEAETTEDSDPADEQSDDSESKEKE